MKCSSLPFSPQSLIHGSSVVIALGIMLGCWVALWQINYNELYLGNNKCFAGNTVATYGGDCAMYCPNSNIIANVNISAYFNANVTTYVYKQPPSSILIEGSNTWTSTQEIKIDDDDEEIGWWFNMNPGSLVSMTFDMQTDEVYLQIDDEDTGYTLPSGTNGNYQYKPDFPYDGVYSRGSKISFKTDNPLVNGTVGSVNFEYVQTYFSKANATENCINFQLLRGCVWSFDFGDDFCLIQFNDQPERNWNSDYSPYCSNVMQDGRDKAFAAILIPISCALVFGIIVANVAISWILSKRQAHMQQQYSEISLSFVEKH